MRIENLETMLLQEMEEVKGGTGEVCFCSAGGAMSASSGGKCECKSGALSAGSCSCSSGALSSNPTPQVPDNPDPFHP